MKTETIFLTGITGTLGAWLAREALSAGHRLVVLVRDTGDSQAVSRVNESLDLSEATQWSDRVEICYGNLCQPGLGLDQAEQVLKNCDRVIHCAAMTSFQPNQAEVNMKTNVEGTRNVLGLAKDLSLPLVYISTAYISGVREGLVKEDELDLGQTFNNSYEESKNIAELMVRRWEEETSLPTVILRPSIVLGDSLQGRIGRFNTIYDLMRMFELLKNNDYPKPLRIIGNALATKNLIPIDYFSRVAWYLIARQQPGTYHITNPNPVSVGAMQDYFSRLFGVEGTSLVGPDELVGKISKAERLFSTAGGVYEPYLLGEPKFDRTHIDAALQGSGIVFPDMDFAYFQRLLDYGRKMSWGRTARYKSAAAKKLPEEVAAYFNDFLTSRLNSTLVPGLQSLTASFKIALKESSDWYWSMVIEQGVLTQLNRNGQATECGFVIDLPTFYDVVSSRITPQQAFFKQLIQINGDVEIGLKAANLLGDFFRQNPCTMPQKNSDSPERLDQSA